MMYIVDGLSYSHTFDAGDRGMNTVISLLLTVVNWSLHDRDVRAAALAMLAMVNDPASLTAKNIAHRAGVSQRVVSKLCASLGFRNLAALKARLVRTQAIRRKQLETHIAKTDPRLLERSIARYAPDTFDSARFHREVEHLNALIHHAPRVIVIGAVFPQALLMHYEEDMIMMGKLIYSMPVAHHLTVPDEVGPDDLLLFVSLTGRLFSYYPDVLHDALGTRQPLAIVGRAPDAAAPLVIPCLTVPSHEDDEAMNAVLLEMMRYLKYAYYLTYETG